MISRCPTSTSPADRGLALLALRPLSVALGFEDETSGEVGPIRERRGNKFEGPEPR